MSWLLCRPIQAITRANSAGDSVPGEGKIYFLGWNMKIMWLMRAVHDKNQIMKPKDENGGNVGNLLQRPLAQK